jgi:hypothetical protein
MVIRTGVTHGHRIPFNNKKPLELAGEIQVREYIQKRVETDTKEMGEQRTAE